MKLLNKISEIGNFVNNFTYLDEQWVLEETLNRNTKEIIKREPLIRT